MMSQLSANLPYALLHFFITFLSAAGLYAQDDYLEYYQLVNTANENFYHQDYQKAVTHYQKAFSRVDYVLAPHYIRAARATAKVKSYKQTAYYTKQALRQGYSPRFLQQPLFKKFRKTDFYPAIMDSLTVYQQINTQQINQPYYQAIDSLYFIDQCILRGAKKESRFEIDSTAHYSDSLNWVHLARLMDLYGFPSEQEIGYQGYRRAWVLLHHNLRLPQNHQYHPMLRQALERGEYMPDNYCWVIDQGQEVKGEALIYYHWDVGSITGLSDEEKIEIDRRRAEVGMPSIRRIEQVQKKGKSIQRTRW